jgi:hypothetical protein
MKKVSLLLLMWVACASFGIAQKKQSLFNKKDLSGWKIYGTEKWYVEKGLLICESGPTKNMVIWQQIKPSRILN